MATNQFVSIGISQLHLDPENPRLPERLRNASEKEVLNWMLSDATLVDLMASIAENGFFNGEPILIVQENGRNIVVEGNRRLASIKLLANPELATESPKTIRSIAETAAEKHNIPSEIWVYKCLDRNEARNYLGFRHVSGVKQWPLISKARYLYNLFLTKNRFDYDVYKEIAKEIGSKGNYVRKLLIGYQAFQIIKSRNWFGMGEYLNEESFNLSLISEVLNDQPSVAEYAGIDVNSEKPFEKVKLESFEELTKWLYQITESGRTRIGDNRNLRLLTKILQNEDAKKAFIIDGKSITEAAELTDLSDENIRYYLNEASASLNEAQKLIHRAKAPSKKDEDLLEEIISSADVIAGHLRKLIRLSKLRSQVKEA
jgi:ParB-like nuclease domain